MSDFKITAYALSRLQTNCYFIENSKTGEVIIVDPADNASFIQDYCEKHNLKPVAVFLTHGHFDHIMAAEDVRDAFKIPIYAGADEKEILADASLNCSAMMGAKAEFAADCWLNGGDVIKLAGFEINVISTPGHTPGSVCYYFKDEDTLISGDTLFRDSFGRTDLPGGNQGEITRSIKDKLFILPDNTVVYPGHGEKSTVGYEKRNNMINGF
jgi:glyoxylase-like metal-dependent hydrolase (beta-lactamase superfamily II)